MLRGFVTRAEDFAKRSGYDNTRRNGALVKVLVERVFHNRLRPRICEEL